MKTWKNYSISMIKYWGLLFLLFGVPLILAIGYQVARKLITIVFAGLLVQQKSQEQGVEQSNYVLFVWTVLLNVVGRGAWILVEVLGAFVLYIGFLLLTTVDDHNGVVSSPFSAHVRQSIIRDVEQYFVPPVLQKPVRSFVDSIVPAAIKNYWLAKHKTNDCEIDANDVEVNQQENGSESNNTSSSLLRQVYSVVSFMYQIVWNSWVMIRLFLSGPVVLFSIVVKTIVWEWGLATVMNLLVLRLVPAIVFIVVMRFVFLPYSLFELYWHDIMVESVFRYVGLLFLLCTMICWPVLMLSLHFSPFVRRIFFLMLEYVFKNDKDGFRVVREKLDTNGPSVDSIQYRVCLSSQTGAQAYDLTENKKNL